MWSWDEEKIQIEQRRSNVQRTVTLNQLARLVGIFTCLSVKLCFFFVFFVIRWKGRSKMATERNLRKKKWAWGRVYKVKSESDKCDTDTPVVPMLNWTFKFNIFMWFWFDFDSSTSTEWMSFALPHSDDSVVSHYGDAFFFYFSRIRAKLICHISCYQVQPLFFL